MARTTLRPSAIIGLLLALTLIVGQGGPAPAAPAGKQVTVAMWSAPDSFNPIASTSWYGILPANLAFDTLVMLDDKYQIRPRLAEKWEISSDATTYTFTINGKAKWTDGRPVTSQDVQFTINTISHPQVTTSRGGTINDIVGTDDNGKTQTGTVEGVQIVSDRVFRIRLKAPYEASGFLEKFGTGFWIVPRHVLQNIRPADFARHEFWTRLPVSSGSFKFVRYATDQFVEMERNPDFFLGAPKLDRIFFRIVQPSVMVAALERGEIDYTTGSGTGDIPLADWDRVRQMANITAYSFVNRGYQYIIINHENPRFKDRRVRQGLVAGINRKLIVDRLLRGEGEVLDVPYTSIFPYRDKTLRPVDFNAERARALLREGGWDFNTPLVLSVPTGNLVREQSAEIVQQNFQALGMQVRLEKFDFPTLIANLREQRFALSFLGWSGNFEPDVSSQYRTGGGFNFGKHSNPAMDSLLDRGRRRPNFDGRKEIYDQFQRMFQNDPPVIMLYSPKALTAVNKRLVNAAPTANIHLWNIHEWDTR